MYERMEEEWFVVAAALCVSLLSAIKHTCIISMTEVSVFPTSYLILLTSFSLHLIFQECLPAEQTPIDWATAFPGQHQ